MKQLSILNKNYNNKVCSFTGYRSSKLNACISNSTLTIGDIEACLKSRMTEMLDEGFTIFRCGMANGADLMFAKIAIELRERYPNLVEFIAAIPCLEHDKGWNEHDRRLCRELTASADHAVLVSDCHYYNGCMAKRNRYLINGCDELLAVYTGQRGGTMQTINYAKGSGIKVTIIDPSKELIITLFETGKTEKSIREIYY
jgi:uncharacterized phage-like protein YoqJ